MASDAAIGEVPSRHCGEEIGGREAMTRLRALSSVEELYRPRSDYIGAVQRNGMSEAWRTKIMAWFGELATSFNLKTDTVNLAINYLDRYLSRRSCGNVNFQLASIASIFLASKVDEARPFRTSDFVTLSDGLFSPSDLRLMELELLCTLKWHLNPLTVHNLIHLLLFLFEGLLDRAGGGRGPKGGGVDGIARVALAYADRVRAEYEFLKYPPSMIAVASVICALKARGVGMDVVSAWMARVHACDLPYAARPDASQSITECGLRLIALDSDSSRGAHVDDDGRDRAEDAEVEEFASTSLRRSPPATSDEEDGAAAGNTLLDDDDDDTSDRERELTSPDNVIDMETHEAFADGPDARFAEKRAFASGPRQQVG